VIDAKAFSPAAAGISGEGRLLPAPPGSRQSEFVIALTALGDAENQTASGALKGG
jgi:hypothetical protein